jgi:curli biogenesis system outer membrane secretion channel CsgG
MQGSLSVVSLTLALMLGACGNKEESKVASSPAAQSAGPAAAPVAPLPDVGKLEQVTVTAQGSGPTAGVAVQEAMKLAILEVNGATIDSSSVAVKFGLDVSEDQTEAMIRGSAFAEAIAQGSRGAITGFKVLSMTDPPERGGLYKVSIEASIAKFRAPADSNKIKVVIAPLHVNTSSFVFGDQSVSSTKVAGEIHQQIINALMATGRFSVLDRDFGTDVQQELDLVSTGQTPKAEMAKLSQSLSADIVWVGTINNMAYARNARKLLTSNRELVSYSGGWSVSQRILNVATRQILLSDTLQEQAPSTDPTTMDRGIDVSQTEGSMESAIVSKAVAAILARTFPVTVLSKDGANVVLSQGGLSVKEGAHYAVVMMGKELTDPQTHQSLGRLESPCCDVVVDKVTPTMAYGRLENPKTSLESVVPAALQVREELKALMPVLADKPEPPPKEVNSASPPVAPVAVPTSTTSTPDESKKW